MFLRERTTFNFPDLATSSSDGHFMVNVKNIFISEGFTMPAGYKML
jgi:hypothetical protein